MKHPRFILGLVLSLVALPFASLAQGGPDMRGPNAQLDPLFMNFLSSVKGFSAENHISITDKRSKKTTTVEAQYEYGEGCMRVTIDMTKMKSPDMNEEAMAQLSMMGMGTMITLSQISKGTTTVIYPDLKAYAEMPNPALAAAAAKTPEAKTVITELGQETIDGHPCVKKKAVMQSDGKPLEALLWTAKDLKDFPVQIKVDDQGTQSTMVFRKIKLETPAATRFQVPAGYTPYKSVPELMQTEMMKKMGAMGQ